MTAAGTGSGAPQRSPPWRHPWVRHLRLGFNLVLSPIYLWGVWLAGGSLLDWRVWLAWLALHVFLYGGTTAFNSYYDRDDGPIGGMRHPPPVDRGLLPWSLFVQAAGLPAALLVGPTFTLAWLVLCVVAAAYSHPRTRLKARPVSALAAVALGQGGVGFLAGWWAVDAHGRGLAPLSDLARSDVLLGALTAALVLCGLYVVTQAYQTTTDRRRGDLTLPVAVGPGRALRWGAVASAAGTSLLALVAAERAGAAWGVAVLLGWLALAVPWWRWAGDFEEAATERNYRIAMRLAVGGGAGLSALLLSLLALG